MRLVDRSRKQRKTGHSYSVGRRNLIVECPDVMLFPADLDIGSPKTVALMPRYPAKTRRCRTATRPVLGVFSIINHTQIAAAIIQTIAVNVINFHSVLVCASKKRSMKTDNVMLTVNPFISSGISSSIKIPAPLVHPIGIGSINKGIGSDRPIAGPERNLYGRIGLHRRLPPVVSRPRTLTRRGVICMGILP